MKLILLGAPGSGKGTHAGRICSRFNIPHISTGDIFRMNIRGNTPLGVKAKEYISKGELVPDSLVIELVKDRLSQADCSNGYVLDGFPRTIAQAEALASFSEVNAAIEFILDHDVIIERVIGRRVCQCGETYNVKFLNGRLDCPKCGGKLYQRDDDKEETIKTRLEVYDKETAPLVDFYKEKNLLVEIDCNGKSIDEVATLLDNVLNEL